MLKKEIEIIAKNQKAITLITLIITIVVLLILASVATHTGVETARSSKLTAFTAQMKIMQTHVNSLYQKKSNGEDIGNIGKELTYNTQVSSQATKVFTQSASGITDDTGYRYFDTETIKGLDIQGVDQEYFINIDKRSVISYDGIDYEGKRYYTLIQLPDGLYNVEYTPNISNAPTFSLSSEQLTNETCRITVSNIQYDGYIEKWQLKYKLEGTENWYTSDNLSFVVKQEGTYTVKISNGDIIASNSILVEFFLPVGTIATETVKDNFRDENKIMATIPEGFRVSEKKGEQEVDTGLVVIGPDGSEFVWIPVETVIANSEGEGTTTKAMVIDLGTESEPIYRGLFYTLTSTGSTVIANCTTTTTGYREVDIVSDYDDTTEYLDTINDILETNLSNSEQLKEKMQEEYNEMIESVKKYGGFYVARYEASESNGKVVSKPNSIALTTYSANRWYGFYAKCKSYVTSSVKSTMIWGSQYDAMMNWMIKNGIDVTSIELPNGGTRNASTTITGVEGSTDVINNVYDLYGGRYELTLEAYKTNFRIRRGGYYDSPTYVPANRFSYNIVNTYSIVGSRPTLYII